MKINRFAIICILTAVFLTVFISFYIVVKAQPADFQKSTVIFVRTANFQPQIVADVIHLYNPRLSDMALARITAAIFKESREMELDPFLITGVIAAESSFRPNAVSPCHAMGLMQLTLGVAQALHLNPFDIEENISGGSRYLHYLKVRFGIDELMLAAYNAGPSRVARLGRIPRIRETLCYIKKISLLRQLMSSKWMTALQNAMTSPLILPFFEGGFTGNPEQSIAKTGDGPTIKCVNLGCRLARADLGSLEISQPILDTRRLQILG